jgi:transposase-like protein
MRERRSKNPNAVTCYFTSAKSLISFGDEIFDMDSGLGADHTTVWRWVQRYAPELEQRMRQHLKSTNKSWRVVA